VKSWFQSALFQRVNVCRYAEVTDLDGNTPLDLAGKNNADKKEAVIAMLAAAAK
jgi:hypothetical protein